MAYRDRTALFLRYRSEARALHGGRGGASSFRLPGDSAGSPKTLTAGSGEALRADHSFADEAGALHQALTEDVRVASGLLNELRSGYAAHLLPRFGEDPGGGALELRLRKIAHALTARLHAADARLHAVARPASGAGAAVQRNLQRRFARELQAISADFRARQKEYLESLRRQQTALGEGSPRAGQYAGAAAQNGGGPGDDAAADEAAQGLLVERAMESTAREREMQLRAVSKSIGDLANIVKDLAGLVVDQGTLLDRVDYNLEDVEENTNAAVQQLHVAENYQRGRQSFFCIILLAVACGVMLILLLLKWTS